MSAPELELSIDGLAAGGDGVGRGPDGRVVFVPATVPGDRVRVQVVQEHRRYLRGRLREVLRAGGDRVEPRCPVFGSCGGCSWQHVAYPAQLRAKRALLCDALQRIGGLRVPEPLPMHASPRSYGYRSRARVHVHGGRVGFLRARSHELCPVSHCPVLEPALDALLEELSDRPPGDGIVQLAAGEDGRVACSAGSRKQALLVSNGEGSLESSAGVFVQGNPGLRGPLARAVVEAAGREGRCLELYAGIGFFTLSLAARFGHLVVVEASRRALRHLRANLSSAGIHHVQVRCEPVEGMLRKPGPSALQPDVIVLDPPRVGLPGGSAERLGGLGARRIVYVSCDPATLARDLRQLTALGYKLERVEGFDLFPQTAHVEAVATLSAGREAGKR